MKRKLSNKETAVVMGPGSRSLRSLGRDDQHPVFLLNLRAPILTLPSRKGRIWR
jgi:hypothetical protein